MTQKESYLHQQGFTMEISHSPVDIDNPSICLDIVSDEYIGRIVVWSTGECQLEIVNVETEETVMDNYMAVSTPAEFDKVFSLFFQRLQIC
jgi:hypothetical protein